MKKVTMFIKKISSLDTSAIILILLFLAHVFFRFYQLQQRAIFGWDQVDNAWAALRIVSNHTYPLIGMVAKGNSGMYIGPLYYYLNAIVYFFTSLHSIASPIFAGLTSMFSFFVIYYVSKNIFTKNVALFSLFIYVFTDTIIRAERNQWPVNFIAPIALLLFYYLYKVLSGEGKYLIHLSIVTGLSFHVHFTSMFYPIIIALTLPLFPWKKITWQSIILSFLSFFICLFPLVIFYTQTLHGSGLGNYTKYFQAYFHGFHLRRFVQLAYDAFIQFETIFVFRVLRNSVFFYIPTFFLLYSVSQTFKRGWKLFYIIALWFLVPWVVFSVYGGEISSYYFSLQQYIVLIIIAYITVWFWQTKQILLQIMLTMFWGYYFAYNISVFFIPQRGNIMDVESNVIRAIESNKTIEFSEGNPESYLYYIYRRANVQ